MRPPLTDRLYYRDPTLITFEGTIVASRQAEGKYVTVLDRSAFYPTSGGQQHDLGTLNGIAIIAVVDAGDEVQHISAEPVGEAGQKVAGEVDLQRRRKHRQQHTAQHILSQTFLRLHGYETVSVHLGDEYGAIELSTPTMEAKQAAEVEQQANEIVQSSWPVEILFLHGGEIEAIPLRKIPSREGTLRVIKIGEFDWSACGGTHCNTTAEVGVIKLIGAEKIRGRTLVKFLAGVQALEDYRLRFDVTDAVSKSLTCHVCDLPGKIGKLADENKSIRKELAGLQKELIPSRASSLAETAESIGQLKVVARVMEGMDASSAGQLSSAVADAIDGLVLLIADGKLLIHVGAGSGLRAGDLAKRLAADTGLRGGGSNQAAQLGGADSSKLDHYRTILLSLIGHG